MLLKTDFVDVQLWQQAFDLSIRILVFTERMFRRKKQLSSQGKLHNKNNIDSRIRTIYFHILATANYSSFPPETVVNRSKYRNPPE